MKSRAWHSNFVVNIIYVSHMPSFTNSIAPYRSKEVLFYWMIDLHDNQKHILNLIGYSREKLNCVMAAIPDSSLKLPISCVMTLRLHTIVLCSA